MHAPLVPPYCLITGFFCSILSALYIVLVLHMVLYLLLACTSSWPRYRVCWIIVCVKFTQLRLGAKNQKEKDFSFGKGQSQNLSPL